MKHSAQFTFQVLRIASFIGVSAVFSYAQPQTDLLRTLGPLPYVRIAPKLEDFASMKPTGAGLALAHTGSFVQNQPVDGSPSSESTDVYMGFDSQRLYLVWVCSDEESARIRANVTPRDAINPDNIYNDDFVEVTLDTFHDSRHGYVFAANPLGVQTDALWTEDAATRDVTWDEDWDSQGLLTNGGYVVLMSIPFKSIRYPSGATQGWGVTLERYVARRNEIDFWPRISSRVNGKLKQEGLLTGIEGVAPSRNFQATPYSFAQNSRSINDVDPGAPYYQSVAAQGRIGGDIKWVLDQSLVLDATINPDFSQLESDQPQNTVNRRFEVVYPEKRPFFLENSNFFDSAATALGLSQLVFTRDIADPRWGVKLSGKRGGWDIGMLMTNDHSPGELVPPEDADYQKTAINAIARIAHDLGQQSNIGMLFTDRELENGFNRVGAIDTSLRLNDNWATYARVAISSTKCANGSELCLAGQTEYSDFLPFGYGYGADSEISLNGHGRRFSLTLQYQDITKAFHTDLGYVPRTDIRNLTGYYHFYFRPEGPRLINWGFETNVQRIWDHQGEGVEYQLNLSPFVGFRNNTKMFFPIASTVSDTLRPQDFGGLTSNKKFVQNGAGIDFSTAPARWFSFNILGFRQGAIDLVVPVGQTPQEADETTLNTTLSVRPTRHMQINSSYVFDRLRYKEIGRSIFNNHIVRSEVFYQPTAKLGFRFIPQYNGLLPNQQDSSLTSTRTLNYDLLLTYLIHPGTAFYFGYNTNFENIAPGLCSPGLAPLACDPNGGLLHVPGPLKNDGRKLFLKLSYQFRL